jgi:hypothetical protein
MSQKPAVVKRPVAQIAVRLLVGSNLLSASDDPVYIGLHGPMGREFRLALVRGSYLRRGREDLFRFGRADDSTVNVANPELNDPTEPPIEADAITGVYLRKGQDPIPNVRAVGELDDRLEVAEIEVEIRVQGEPVSLRFSRAGPIWLELVYDLCLELPRVDPT